MPIFLVLGSANVRQETALVRAAGLSLRVHDVPEGPAPLHWYAGPDGIVSAGGFDWLDRKKV